MEVEYTVWNGTQNVSVWLPVSIQGGAGPPYINTDCKPNSKHPDAPVCVNGTMKTGFDMLTTHTSIPKNIKNLGSYITG